MKSDDFLIQAARDAAALPATGAAERAAFEHLRADFQGAFRAARAEMGTAGASPVELVIHLATRVFEVLGDALRFPGQELAGATRGGGAAGAGPKDQVVWEVAPGVEALLFLAREAGGSVALEVDLVQGFERVRPFWVTLLDGEGAELGARRVCESAEETLRLELGTAGRHGVELAFGEDAVEMFFEVRSAGG